MHLYYRFLLQKKKKKITQLKPNISLYSEETNNCKYVPQLTRLTDAYNANCEADFTVVY